MFEEANSAVSKANGIRANDSSKKLSKSQNIEIKTRYIRKQEPKVPTKKKPEPAKITNPNDSLWSLTDSTLVFGNDDKKLTSSSIGFKPNKINPKQEQSSDNSEYFNIPLTSSVIKWSNQFNNTPRGNNFDQSANSSLIEIPKKEAKKVRIDNKIEMNRLMDIIERENTNFSVKLSYDKPFSNRLDALTPHTYLDLDIDPNLRLARENTIKNMKDVFVYENEQLKKIDSQTPDLYQTLEKPKNQVNVYTELNLLEDFVMAKKKSLFPTKTNYSITKSKTSLKHSQSLKLKPKLKKENLVYQSTDIDSAYDKENELLNSSLIESKNFYSSIDIYSNQNLNQTLINSSSNTGFDQIQNDSILINNNLTPSNNQNNLIRRTSDQNRIYMNQKQFDLSIYDGLIHSMKLKEALKETPTLIKKQQSPKQQQPRKSKLNNKKPKLKEFKYCILTDLKIGEGEFSETFQGYRYDLGPPLKIAAKRLKISKEKDEQNIQNLLSEISVLSQLGKHHYVIDFMGVFNHNSTMYLIFEYCEKGDLKRLLDICRKNSKRDFVINNLYKLRIAYEIASGMEYISSLDIVHKDLAARNILLDKDFSCKIADFGCCKAEFLTKMPIRWMAPETLNKLLFTTASDVWSFGVLLWEIYTYGITPYPGMTDDEVIGRINQWYRLYKPQDCPNEVYAIMLSCWKDYHKARPRFFNLKNKFRDLYKFTNESQQNQNSNNL